MKSSEGGGLCTRGREKDKRPKIMPPAVKPGSEMIRRPSVFHHEQHTLPLSV